MEVGKLPFLAAQILFAAVALVSLSGAFINDIKKMVESTVHRSYVHQIQELLYEGTLFLEKEPPRHCRNSFSLCKRHHRLDHPNVSSE